MFTRIFTAYYDLSQTLAYIVCESIKLRVSCFGEKGSGV